MKAKYLTIALISCFALAALAWAQGEEAEGTTEVTNDDVILDKIQEIDATLTSPCAAYAMKKEIRRVQEANKEKLPKGGKS